MKVRNIEKNEGKKLKKCIFINLIDTFEERIDKTCKKTINDKIFIVLETFSTLSNF